jgi:hypothetical protein
MQIEYEISEQDFLNAQKLAIRKSPSRAVRLIATVMPWFGAVLLIFVVTAGLSEGLSWAFLPGLLMPIFMLSIPVLNRRTQKKMYARATAMHGSWRRTTQESRSLELRFPRARPGRILQTS